MTHLTGEDKTGGIRLDFDCRVRLDFHGSKISSDGGLLLFRKRDEVLGLHDIAEGMLIDPRKGHTHLQLCSKTPKISQKTHVMQQNNPMTSKPRETLVPSCKTS